MLRRIVATVPALCFIKLGVIDIIFHSQIWRFESILKMIGDSTCTDAIYCYHTDNLI